MEIRRTASALAAFNLFAISAAAQAAACPTGDPVSQVAALEQQTDAISGVCNPAGSNPSDNNQVDCPNKPDESVVTGVIACLQPIADSQAPAPRVRAEAEMQLSTLYGIITQFYSSGLGKRAPGKTSYFDLRTATQDDPTYEDAWVSFGQVVDGFSASGWLDRQEIQLGLGINIGDERSYAIQGLQDLAQPDPQAVALLQKLRSY